MNKVVVCLLSLMFVGMANAQKKNDPIIMEIDGNPIYKSEFLQIYLKNNPNPSYDKAALDNYMDLFKKFKLKVHEAEVMQLDTLPKLKNELQGYVNQLARPYLVDSSETKFLMQQAYDRMKAEVRASHILVQVDENAAPVETLKAYNKIMQLRKQIVDGGAKFEDIAKKASDDKSAKTNGGDLGYFSAFQMVYPFENAAYNTPVGKVSMPVRSRYGYHILYVQDKKPTKGLIHTSHIMIMLPKNNDAKANTVAKAKIDEIYQKLQNGEDFASLAKRYSQDQTSRNKGGVLPAFGAGSRQRMVPAFEKMAFSLQKDGDYSEPFKTRYGWHIVQRNSLTPLEPFDSLKPRISAMIKRDARSSKTQASFINKLKQEYKFKDKSSKELPWFYKHIDSTIFTVNWVAPKTDDNATMFTFAKQDYTRKDFLKALDKLKGNSRYNGSLIHFINTAYQNWQDDMILAYEKAQLPIKYPKYKAIVSEYHDGVLLYEIMNDKVWNKAIQDTVGLKKFYENNKTKFTWEDRIDATIYICDNQKIADKVYKMLQVDTVTSREVLKIINKDSKLNLLVRTNKYETQKVDYLKNRQFKLNANKPYEFKTRFYVVDVKEKIPAGPKKLEEARGLVTADYQNYLEQEWMKQLEKKYPVVVHKEVLYSLGK